VDQARELCANAGKTLINCLELSVLSELSKFCSDAPNVFVCPAEMNVDIIGNLKHETKKQDEKKLELKEQPSLHRGRKLTKQK